MSSLLPMPYFAYPAASTSLPPATPSCVLHSSVPRADGVANGFLLRTLFLVLQPYDRDAGALLFCHQANQIVTGRLAMTSTLICCVDGPSMLPPLSIHLLLCLVSCCWYLSILYMFALDSTLIYIVDFSPWNTLRPTQLLNICLPPCFLFDVLIPSPLLPLLPCFHPRTTYALSFPTPTHSTLSDNSPLLLSSLPPSSITFTLSNRCIVTAPMYVLFHASLITEGS